MAQGIVDILETVHVEEQQRSDSAAPVPCVIDSSGKQEGRPVRIMVRQVLHRSSERFDVCDIENTPT
jgi:hypothetical protein